MKAMFALRGTYDVFLHYKFGINVISRKLSYFEITARIGMSDGTLLA